MTRPRLYIVSDGKPGHLAQSRGLAQAIARRIECDTLELDADQPAPQAGVESGLPGLVLAAGRRTHRRALVLGKQLSVPAVALMNPGWLGRRRFDLCVIPRHDGVGASGKVILTDGALNGIVPATKASPDEGLILVGGPSKHHDWEADWIEKQVEALLEREPTTSWAATDSRRTPEVTTVDLAEIAQRSGGRLVFTPSTQTPRGWVAEQLQRCGVCWVTEDSVSMVYEALTAGARVGLLPVLRKTGKPGRVVRGVESLVERGWVTGFAQWRQGQPLPADLPPLAEADRVAGIILQRWEDLCA